MSRNNKGSGGASVENALPIEAIEFKPIAPDKQQQQGIIIACRSLEAYPVAAGLIVQAKMSRAEQIMLDYSQQGVAVAFRVDGIWERMPPMDRPTGDAMLVVLKRLGSLNPADRRSRQSAKLPLRFREVDWIATITSQGTPTGERVVIVFDTKKPILVTLSDLGMREKLQEQYKALINSEKALFLFSGPPSHGLPTTWRVGLESADRFVRDFHSIYNSQLDEPELINITPHPYDESVGESAMDVLKSLLLKEPDVLVMPELVSPEVCKLLCDDVQMETRSVITRIQGNSAIEAMLRLMATYKASAKDLVKITNGVINQRLVRRLCTNCRQPFQPPPQLLQKLGIPPGRIQVLYQPTIPPPPEQRVDANGKPIEIPICPKCNGRGYYGRAAIFELLIMNDAIRQAFIKTPTPEAILQTATQNGFITMQQEGVLSVATGLTSLQELQRILAGNRPAR